MSRLPTPEYDYMHRGSGTPIAGAGVAIRGPIWNACPETYAIILQASLQPKTSQTPLRPQRGAPTRRIKKGLGRTCSSLPSPSPSLQVCAMRSTCCSLAPPIFLAHLSKWTTYRYQGYTPSRCCVDAPSLQKAKDGHLLVPVLHHLALIFFQHTSLIYMLRLVSNKKSGSSFIVPSTYTPFVLDKLRANLSFR